MVKSNKLHLFGFFTVLVGLLLLTSYQLFVTPQFTRIPIKKFLQLQTLKQLFYQAPDIGNPQNFGNPNPLTLTCQPGCLFTLNDQLIPAMVDNDPEALVTDITLQFFDQDKGLIGYQINNPDNPTFYVLDLSGRLLQTIRLNLNQFRQLEFTNYYPTTQEIMFTSTHQTTQEIKHWLYQATSPSLRQIHL